MRRPWILTGTLLVAVAMSDCNCEESLGVAVGQIELTLCDRQPACECTELGSPAVIEFGNPEVGTVARRTVRIQNGNAPRKLVISRIDVGADSEFQVTGIQHRSSGEDDAEVTNHKMADGSLTLENDNLAEIFLTFQPGSTAESSTTLTIVSNSALYDNWEILLRGGGGSAEACVPSGDCGDGSVVDFGTHSDVDIAYDPAVGLPTALDTQMVTVTNQGPHEIFFTAAITVDGIPEVPGEVVGDRAVFFLGDLGCPTLAAGESADIPIEYRPSTAGEHFGKMLIKGVGAPVYIDLEARVTGAHVCLRTEDDLPNDSTLQFGDAPDYRTPSNAEPEIRHVWVQNCGFQEDLVISAAQLGSNTDPDFSSTALPWAQTSPIAPGEEIEVAVALGPVSPQLVGVDGNLELTTNDLRLATAYVHLQGFIGLPEVCYLTASPSPVDFGWVASDDAAQGTCVPPIILPNCARISRMKTVRLINIGERACDNIEVGPVTTLVGTAGMFTMPSTPTPFRLEPGDVSDAIDVLFAMAPQQDPINYSARLEFTSPENAVGTADVLLQAIGGGSPACAVEVSPLSPPTISGDQMCPYKSLKFGGVNYGNTRTLNMQIRNIGSEDCVIDNVRKKQGTADSFSFPTTSFNIAIGASHTIPVSFESPVPSGGLFEDFPFGCVTNGMQFDYASQSTDWATETVPFLALGKPPSIDVIPGEIDFGEVTVGCCSAQRRVSIYNSGITTLDLDGVAVLRGVNFIATSPSSMSIRVSGSSDFMVQFCATAEGEAVDVVEITGHDQEDNEEFITVSLSGTGVLDSQGNDQYRQPSRPMVDVLFVVDDSGSMQGEQDELAANFDAFIGQAVELDTDYHLGVTNTDGETEWAGRLHACTTNAWGKFIVDSQPPAQQETQFSCNVNVSDPADGRPSTDNKESALHAARSAFEYATLEWNEGFYREAAKLYIILVTDEVDQSDGTAALYFDFFQNLKGIGNPDLLNISAITGPPPDGCESSNGAAESNLLDFNAVELAGGQFRSICSADWTDLLDSLGLDVFNARRQFPLSRPATPVTIDVWVCPSTCPEVPSAAAGCTHVQQNGADGWTYDADVNAVTFHGNSLPEAGECVAVSYIAMCYAAGEG
ncbi:MAG: hypothetical protein A2289_20065 [Deltaproteobacteria bacterium RIFOXYA12_FULL_58_15]|nr:MAG: hypothetical protein A2289_20065 [Deltaproteobacteria bacterium RIFOXYA12_FULL_58_15]